MKSKVKPKPTILEIVAKVLDSDLPISTRNEITRYYMLPKLGMTKAIVEDRKFDVGTVERPDAEEIMIESNPKLKAEYEDTERVMGFKADDDEEE